MAGLAASQTGVDGGTVPELVSPALIPRPVFSLPDENHFHVGPHL
jgi:hypothetical protein